MKLIKRYKWIILGFFILLIIILGWVFKDFFLSHDGSIYGNRLDSIKDVPIDDALKKEMAELLTSEEGIKTVKTNVKGSIIYINIYVDETITISRVKEMANETLTKLSEEQLAAYDLSFLIDYASDTENKDFPIAGYKNKNKNKIVW